MTILDHTGAAALQRSQIIAELAESGMDGVIETRVKELGGYHWEKRIVELQRDHTIGWDLIEGEKYFFLVASRNGVGRRGDMAVSLSADDESDLLRGDLSIVGSPSTLFELTPRRHYEDYEAA